ncbi:hypothetical protein [Stieleria varia]|uniref:hypothetical protein n=1 Tax=Stieleria varia TaxID=2528005 RepID=UPI0011B485D7|nr:hypothetical protein [Stieleria varia]
MRVRREILAGVSAPRRGWAAREVNDLSVLVTEFIDGLDVGQILRRTDNLAICDACEIARQAVLALQ